MKYIITVVSLLLSSNAYAMFTPYFLGQAGLSAFSDNAQTGSVGEIRGGTQNRFWEASLGYLINDNSTDGDKLLPVDLTLHTLNAEIYRKFSVTEELTAKIGGGFGYTTPTLGSGTFETLESGVPETLGLGLDYQVAKNVSVGILGRLFAFNTVSHRTTEVTSNSNVLVNGIPNGQTVQTVDYVPSSNSVNFNALLVTAGVKISF